ncbi:diguanylate cyclase [Pseudoalteromonas sp. L23]|uniref:GGDEF domain-containing protein n=1 Tax=unclassified Pseudoalteromonas TaxID=194690 RepID=UPI001EF0F07A|nr:MULTISPECIES: GGDEF domain-containing protein [unclassified Pseudoalteromonas]MCF7516506.1 diguanylate cyclase [Pseudoalteromonas sp. L7]MCF7528552.1 diguanylate cyclase [Pseudoalteromonas sp. L23]MCX2769700.1 diguanylate cyclase [Pseudoalteromonas sp. B530]
MISNRLIHFWQGRSLRFWLTSGLIVTIVPFFLFSIIAFSFVHSHIVEPLLTLSGKQQKGLNSINEMQIATLEATTSLADFAISQEEQYFKEFHEAYEKLSQSLDIIELHSAEPNELLKGEYRQAKYYAFAALDRISSSLSTTNQVEVDKAIIEAEGNLEKLGHALTNMSYLIQDENTQIHHNSLEATFLSEKIFVFFLLLSVLFGITGLLIINKSLISSMNKLTEGATKFATGDVEHNINIGIPCEMASVAHTFNCMKETILKQQAELEHMASCDRLTGLPNRHKFDELAILILENAQNFGTQFCLVICDIDHFKKLNDQFGHLCGDEALKIVSIKLQSAVPRDAHIFRYGGEEFIILLPNRPSSEGVTIAEELRRNIQNSSNRFSSNEKFKLTASFGVSTFPEHGETIDKLIEEADKALYRSKESGRNSVSLAYNTK